MKSLFAHTMPTITRVLSLVLFAAGIAVVMALPVSAQASNRWWDGGASDIGGNGNNASAGGSGTWNTTLKNWDAGSVAHTNWINGSNDTAIFGGTAGTVSLGTGITVGGLQFDTASYIITNNTVTFGSAGSIVANQNASINSVIAGSVTITKSGTNTLTLTGSNTCSGTTLISQGVLQLNKSAFTANARNYSIASGATLQIGGGGTNTAPAGTTTFSGSGTLRIMSGTTNRNTSGAGCLIAMSLDSGGLIDIPAGAALYNGSAQNTTWNSNLADMTVDGIFDLLNGYTVTIAALNGNGIITKSFSSGTVGLTIGANGGTGTFNGNITNIAGYGAISLTKTGTGTQTLTGNNTYIGPTTINGGTLQIGGAGQLGGGDYSRAITNNASFIYASSATQTLSGVISGTGSLTKSGTNTLTLTGSNTCSGTTTISGGTLQIGNGGVTGSIASATIANDASIVYNFNSTGIASLPSYASGTGNLTATAGTIYLRTGTLAQDSITLTQAGGQAQWHGIGLVNNATISTINATAITLTGDLGTYGSDGGSLTLNTTANGAITLNISIGRNSTWNNPSSFTANAGTGTLTLSGANAANGWKTAATTLIGALNISSSFSPTGTLNLTATSASTVSGNLALSASTNTFICDPEVTMTVSGVLSGASAAITKLGTGTLTLTGTNTYAGPTTITSGTLQIGGAGQLGGGTYSRAITNNAALIYASATNQTFSGLISGTGSLTKISTSALTLSSTNTYSGGTTVNGGVLILAAGSAGRANIRGTVTVNSGAEVRLFGGDGTGLGFVTNAKIDTININGGLLNSSNMCYVTNTTINMTGGELRINNGTSNPTTTNYFEWCNTPLNTFASSTQALITGRIRIRQEANPILTFTVGDGSASTDLLVSAAITQSSVGCGITKTGPGTMAVSGSNSYDGITTVDNGTLVLDYSSQNNSKLSDSSALVLNNANLILSSGSTNEITGGMTLNGNSYISRSGGTSTIDLKTITYGTGALNVEPDVARCDNALSAGVYPNWLTINYELATTNTAGRIVAVGLSAYTNIFRLGGIISNAPAASYAIVEGGSSGNVTTAVGKITINALFNKATGGPTIVDINDTLRFQNMGVIGMSASHSGSWTFQNGYLTAGNSDGLNGTLILNNLSATYPLIINSVINDNAGGVVSLIKDGAGKVLLNNTNTYSGSTVINKGTLELGGAGLIGSGSYAGSITNKGLFSYNSSVNQLLSGFISGTGAIAKTGTGTLTMSYSNNLSGDISVNTGTIVIAHSFSLGTGNLTLNGAKLELRGYGFEEGTFATASLNTGVLNPSRQASTTMTRLNSQSGFGTNTEWIYSGYFYVSGSTNVLWTFGENIDESAWCKIDDNVVLNDVVWDNPVVTDVTLTPGWHRIEARAWNSADSAGPAATYNWPPTLGLGYDNIGRGSIDGSFFAPLSDPGDGSFIAHALTARNNVILSSGYSEISTPINGPLTNAITGAISGSGGLIKTGAGTLSLTGNNTFTGNIIISNGVLNLHSSGGGAITNFGTLGIGATATNMAVTSLGMETNSVFMIDLTNCLGVAGEGWDMFNAGSGAININSTTGSPCILKLYISDPAFDASESYTWQIAVAGSINGFNSNKLSLVNALSNPVGNGFFSIIATSTNLSVVFTSVLTTNFWDGGDTLSASWSSATNWLGNSPPNRGKKMDTLIGSGPWNILNNDLADPFSTRYIVFSNELTGFTLTGYPLQLYAGILNESAFSHVIDNDIILSSNIVINTGDAEMTLSGTISGSGSLTKIGTGTLTINGCRSYTGATVISNGTIVAASGFADASEFVLAGGNLVITNGNTAPKWKGLINHYLADDAPYDDGYYITEWPDSSGAGQSALIGSGSVTLESNILNGHSVARFPTNDSGWLSFNTRTNIRSVFWVLKEGNTTAAHLLLGDDDTSHFYRGTASIWDSTASAYVKGGTTRLGGNVVNGLSTQLAAGEFNLLSLITSGNVEASRITADQTSKTWIGDIAEIMIFNRAVSDQEEGVIGSYLAWKYGLPTSYQNQPFTNLAIRVLADTEISIYSPTNTLLKSLYITDGVTATYNGDPANYLAFQNLQGNGNLSIDSGYLELNNSSFGTLTVNGKIGAGPGITDLALGTLNISSNSELIVDIGGTTPATEYDTFSIAETATLAGKLSITLTNGYYPAGGVFTIISAGSVTGRFSEIMAPTLSNNFIFAAKYYENMVTLTPVSNGISVLSLYTSPTAPTFLDGIYFFANLQGSVTNLRVTLFYQEVGSPDYQSVSMINTGGLWRTPSAIPRQFNMGTASYYLQYNYEISGGNDVIAYYPPGGELSPATYTNYDSSNTQNWDDVAWLGRISPPPGTQGMATVNNWSITNSFITTSNTTYNSYSSPRACWMYDCNDPFTGKIYTNPAVHTPILTNGAGAINFYGRNLIPGTNWITIDKSFNSGASWSSITNFQCATTDWTRYSICLDYLSTIKLRFMKTNDVANDGTSKQYFGIDDIQITYPPTMVIITNVMLHPGYPNTNDPAQVHCDVSSVNSMLAATDIVATVYYRYDNVSPFTNTLTMTQQGASHYYADFDKLPARTRVEYFISVSFTGYVHEDSSQKNPVYYPEVTLDTFNSMIYSFSGYTQTDPLMNFPVLLKFNGNAFYNGLAYPDGRDLRIYDYASSEEYDYTWESINSNGTSYLWVKVPELTSNTMLWVTSGDRTITNACEKTNVWDENYAAVWHMGEANAIDSTTNRFQGTGIGNTTAQGIVGNSQSFDGINDYIAFANTPSPEEASWTVELWFNWQNKSGDLPFYSRGSQYASKINNGYIQYKWKPGIAFDGGAYSYSSKEAWHFTAVSYDGTKQRLYNDNLMAYSTNIWGSFGISTDSFQIAKSDLGYFKGSLDEVRISNVARSSNYLWAVYKNIQNNTAFPIMIFNLPGAVNLTSDSIAPLYFDVRAYQSDYDSISMTGNLNIVDMEVINDNLWQGVLDITSFTNNISWLFKGYGYYTNSLQYYSTNIHSWGVAEDMSNAEIPLTGVATLSNALPIIINIETSYLGQVLVKFDRESGVYSVKKCKSQDFNSWRASKLYFEASIGNSYAQIATNNFNSWPTSRVQVLSHFVVGDEWTSVNATWTKCELLTYTNHELVPESGGWYVDDVEIVQELDPRNNSAYLSPTIGQGKISQDSALIGPGLGTVKFDYRAYDPTRHPTWYTNSAVIGSWDNIAADATFYSTDISPGRSYISIFARYNGIDSYELRMSRHSNQVDLVLGLYKNATNSPLQQTTLVGASLSSAHTMRLIVVTNQQNYVLLEGYVDTLAWNAQKLRYYDTSGQFQGAGGIGLLSFDCNVLFNPVTVKKAAVQLFGNMGVPLNTMNNTNIAGWTYKDAGWTTDNMYLEKPDVRPPGITNGFIGWPNTNIWGSSSGGWTISDGMVTNANGNATTNFCVLGNAANANIVLPVTTDAGSLVFWTRNIGGAASITYRVEISNSVAGWVPASSRISTSTNVWIKQILPINTNGQCNIRIVNTQAPVVGQYLGIDDVKTTPQTYMISPDIGAGLESVYFKYSCTSNNTMFQISGATNNTDNPTNYVLLKTIVAANTNYNNAYLLQADLSGAYKMGDFRRIMFKNTDAGNQPRFKDFQILSSNVYNSTITPPPTGWDTGSGKWYYSNGRYVKNGYSGPAVLFSLDTANTNSGNDTGPDPSYYRSIQSFSASNCQYMSTSIVVKTWEDVFTRFHHTNGNAQVAIDNIDTTSWRGDTFISNTWTVSEGWIEKKYGTGTENVFAMYRSKADPASRQFIRSPRMTNGVGEIWFDMKCLNGPALFKIYGSTNAPDDYSVDFGTFTNTATDWDVEEFKLALFTNQPMYITIQIVTNNPETIFYIDNIEITDCVPKDSTMWSAYNALISDRENVREFERYKLPEDAYKSAYLNNMPNSRTRTGLDVANPYIQSPLLTNGIGEIGFWYRCWDIDGLPGGNFIISYSPDEFLDDTNWTVICTINNVTNVGYIHFSTNLYIPTNYFIRIYAQTNGTSKLCLDDAYICDPYGANLKLGSIQLDPAIPMTNDNVYISAQISNFYLNPSNIQVTAFWQNSTNNWAAWPQTTNFLVLDQVVSSNPLSRTLRSSTSIPKFPVDTVVQYYVQASFNGEFSNYTSPKQDKSFTNPPWYEPVNLNSNTSVTNPYYFVFSCPPQSIWINEFNYNWFIPDEATNEYVEICGPSGSDITNWQVKLVAPTTYTIYDFGIVTNGPLGNATNLWGFWVYGDALVATAQTKFAVPSNNNLRINGGIILQRSMGAHEQKICYGESNAAKAMQTNGFTYVFYTKDPDSYSPLALEGTGSNYSHFAWKSITDYELSPHYSPGRQNENQLLCDTNAVYLTITGFSKNSTNMWLVFEMSGRTITPQIWYSTNIASTNNWAEMNNTWTTTNGNTYTQWFNIKTNESTYFLKVSTNSLIP